MGCVHTAENASAAHPSHNPSLGGALTPLALACAPHLAAHLRRLILFTSTFLEGTATGVGKWGQIIPSHLKLCRIS